MIASLDFVIGANVFIPDTVTVEEPCTLLLKTHYSRNDISDNDLKRRQYFFETFIQEPFSPLLRDSSSPTVSRVSLMFKEKKRSSVGTKIIYSCALALRFGFIPGSHLTVVLTVLSRKGGTGIPKQDLILSLLPLFSTNLTLLQSPDGHCWVSLVLWWRLSSLKNKILPRK